MNELINNLRNKSIHVVGVTGAEGSSILKFLVKHKIPNIIAHDFSDKSSLEKNFKLWHKGIEAIERNKLYQEFKKDISLVKLKLGPEYLEGIDKSDIIFVPQSWRLYKTINGPLFLVSGKIPFYSLTRLYLDCTPAKIVAVTGTVGKGSTANIIYQLLKKAGMNVYYAGNDTWMPQLADKLDEMTKDDVLILEISHRQLQDGFTRAPHIVVVTNLYPNHLDEVSGEEYVNLKLSLVKKQESSDLTILNYDSDQLRLVGDLKSKVIYFSKKNPEMNTKSIQKIYPLIMNNKSDHYPMNILAGMTACNIIGLSVDKMLKIIPQIKSLPARLELLKTSGDIKIYNDLKSTTPWATIEGLKKLGKNTILVCGGRTKGIDYKEFSMEIEKKVKYLIILKSELGEKLARLLPVGLYEEASDLSQALQSAYKQVEKGDNILISPTAGFFYSDFIRGKKSIRRIIKKFDMNHHKPDSKSNGIPE